MGAAHTAQQESGAAPCTCPRCRFHADVEKVINATMRDYADRGEFADGANTVATVLLDRLASHIACAAVAQASDPIAAARLAAIQVSLQIGPLIAQMVEASLVTTDEVGHA